MSGADFGVNLSGMKSIDVISSVDYGYRLVWAERSYLLRLATVPFAVKILTYAAIIALGWEQEYIKAALISLPSLFAEGWMLAHLVRLVFLGQRWPFSPKGDPESDRAELMDRAYGITAGTLFFVVIQFLVSGIRALTAEIARPMIEQAHMQAQTGTAAEPDPIPALIAFMIVFTAISAFRFIFLYIPASVGIKARVLAPPERGFLLSIQAIAVFLVCFIPCSFVALFIMSGLIPDAAENMTGPINIPFTNRAGMAILESFTSVVISLIVTAAMAHGILSMIEKSKKSV